MSLVEPPVGRAMEIQQEEMARRQEAARQHRPPIMNVESPSDPTDVNGDGSSDGTLGEARLAALNAVAEAEVALAQCRDRHEQAATTRSTAAQSEQVARQKEEEARAALSAAQIHLAYVTGIPG